jgi:hypothetical protein
MVREGKCRSDKRPSVPSMIHQQQDMERKDSAEQGAAGDRFQRRLSAGVRREQVQPHK